MENRTEILRGMKLCRFCLESSNDLRNIYEPEPEDSSGVKHVPLALQIMACVGIEVVANDGMPQYICNKCRSQTQKSYIFKANCKEADDALKLFLATGTLIKPYFKKDVSDENLTSIKRSASRSKSSRKAKKAKTDDEAEMSPNYDTMDTDDNNLEYGEVRRPITGNQSSAGDDYDEEDPLDSSENNDSPGRVKQMTTRCFPCRDCDRTFPLKQLLDLHMVNHGRERCFECEQCTKRFYTKYDLLKHLKCHNDLKPFNCVVCNKSFSRESLLHRHEKTHVDAPKYLCTQCDRTFLTREDLDIHCEKHKMVRPYACPICNKSFVFKQGLERHVTTHAANKPFKCNYCEASFNSTIKLTRHITSHAGLRPYPCKICGRTFLLSHHLTRHMRSHYAAKVVGEDAINKYKCDICSMAFKRKDSLINHTAIHSMVNLKCVICNTAFDDAHSVRAHINTHLSGLPHPCAKCDYSFETKDQLEEHEVKHAEMEYEEQIEKEVVEEAKKEAELEESNLQDEDDFERGDIDDDVDEFTITSGADNNPEVVRRSSRLAKPKAFPEYLKDEVLSEPEVEEPEVDEDYPPPEPSSSDVVDDYTIKPIVRSERTKVYTRKSQTPKEKPVRVPIVTKSDAPISIDNFQLTNQELDALPTKKYVDMKIGNKMVRVQKLIVTKDEMLAMARDGKIKVKGKTILYKKTPAESTSAPVILNNSIPVVNPDITSVSITEDGNIFNQSDEQHNESNETNGENIQDDDDGMNETNMESVPIEDVSTLE